MISGGVDGEELCKEVCRRGMVSLRQVPSRSEDQMRGQGEGETRRDDLLETIDRLQLLMTRPWQLDVEFEVIVVVLS